MLRTAAPSLQDQISSRILSVGQPSTARSPEIATGRSMSRGCSTIERMSCCRLRSGSASPNVFNDFLLSTKSSPLSADAKTEIIKFVRLGAQVGKFPWHGRSTRDAARGLLLLGLERGPSRPRSEDLGGPSH